MAYDLTKLVKLGQLITLATYVKTLLTGKVDKVTNATANNLTAFASNGVQVDSGIPKVNVLQTTNVATDAEVTEAITEVLGS